MSTDTTDNRSDETRDPTNDEYLELDRRFAAAEYKLAADLAEADKEVDEARKAGDPTKDEYLEVDKRVAAAEYTLAAGLAEADKELDEARETGAGHFKAAIEWLDTEAAARTGKARAEARTAISGIRHRRERGRG